MHRKTASQQKTSDFKYTPHSKDLPATQGMLHLVRTEIKAEMKAGFRQIDSRFDLINSKFNENDSRFSQIDSRFNQIDSRFNQMDSKFEQVLSEVARVGLLVEEQNSRNRVVLEGLTGLWQRQERVEVRVDNVESLVRSITRPKDPA
jgi:tetrahydromethanopterin S-methyltransferase subunit G